MRALGVFTSVLVATSLFMAQKGCAQSVDKVEVDLSGPIRVEPDSIARNLLVRNRVRSVVKVRLDDEGAVRDTVSLQLVDPSGRYTRIDQLLNPQLHREWSYDEKGRCTSLVTHPTSYQPFTLIYSYNPALQKGLQQALKPNGKSIPLSEVQLQQRGDTLLTETRTHTLLANGSLLNFESRRLSRRYSPHPDTVLILAYNYSAIGQLVSTAFNYSVSRQGQPIEIGRLDMEMAAKLQKVKVAPKQAAPQLTPAQALQVLRQGKAVYPQFRWRYDAQQRIVGQEMTPRLNKQGQGTTTQLEYTYNSLNQLIGRQQITSSIYTPSATAFTVYSYAPNGLLLGETSDARSEKPIFYRYQYQYYE
ncbi:hypothetical protein SAMN06265337_1783 [Hymenobacter gelipurpurascens]|uniref:YD repeat-containing protein n=1 Tax=Hymenobacter gelipurpurascens TaxID=89968 RepID=A0A212TM88_9BACT|nr:hypothetical protein [Hymenobacter gelipurpurascens]SNC66944.1 hypothetical protein SAMN06265337_1783 [Hymenobacter gelipurpurascens]